MNLSNKYYSALGAVTALALMSPFAAMAQEAGASALSAGVQAAADEGKAQLWIIGGIVVGVCIIGFLIGRAKRTSS